MKAMLISIKPEYVAKILNGEKTIEIRKNKPRVQLPIDVYIYCTKTHYHGYISKKYAGKVVAKFTLNNVEELTFLEGLYSLLDRGYCTDTLDNAQVEIKSCVPQEKIIDYLYSKGKGSAWHIDNLKIFEPKSLSVFDIRIRDNVYRRRKAPQSWCYVEEITREIH